MLNLFFSFCMACSQPYSLRVSTSVITGRIGIGECVRHFSSTSELFQRSSVVDLPRTHFAPKITPKELSSKTSALDLSRYQIDPKTGLLYKFRRSPQSKLIQKKR